MTNQTALHDFQRKVLHHEAKFIREVGVDAETGLTLGKIPLHKRTGMPMVDKISSRSSLKAEAVHIAILGKALIGDHRASEIYS